MRTLLDSSWMKFGPAGRGSYDWVTGAPSPSVEKQRQGYHWNEMTPSEGTGSEVILYVLFPTASFLVICLLAFLIYKSRACGKQGLANVIALGLQDSGKNGKFLSSLTWDGEQFPSTSSNLSDGVFLMVYLPPPYEETLTRITRAASTSSSKDVDCASHVTIDDFGAKL